MKKCPKCGYERKLTDAGAQGTCPSCGLVFAKWVSRTLGTTRLPREEGPADTASAERSGAGGGTKVRSPQTADFVGNESARREGAAADGRFARLAALLTHVEPRTDPILFWGRVALYAALLIWGWYFILLDFRSNEIGHSFMHRVNLVFHEAGHVVFMAFGQFMHVLGGSLGQLLMPAIVSVMLVYKNQDNFGGSIGLWWFAQSLMDLAPYINDARDLQLPLLTGHSQDVPETHDWANILIDLNLIYHEKQIAFAADAMGTLIMLLAMVWGGYILLQQYRNLESGD